jgi:hypothetical protein
MGQDDLIEKEVIKEMAKTAPDITTTAKCIHDNKLCDTGVALIELHKIEDNDSSETQSDTSSDLSLEVSATVKPMLDILKLDKFDSFVIDSHAGLTGTTVIAQYPSILDSKKFFVWIGNSEFSYFGKHTFLNLANFAEEKGAESIFFIVSGKNEQRREYERMFKVIDAERVRSLSVQDLIKKDLIAKVLDLAFYKLDL